MTEKLRLNKGALRETRERLRLYRELLPTLRLRQRRLRSARDELDRRRRERDEALTSHRREATPWAAMLRHDAAAVEPFAAVEGVDARTGTIAGVTVPVLERVRFPAAMPARLATPPAYDDAVAYLRREAELRAELDLLAEQRARVDHELRRVTQRINLYDEVLIPKARADIRRLRVYLGDQQTAAVCRAKIAKAKLLARASHTESGGERWPSSR